MIRNVNKSYIYWINVTLKQGVAKTKYPDPSVQIIKLRQHEKYYK